MGTFRSRQENEGREREEGKPDGRKEKKKGERREGRGREGIERGRKSFDQTVGYEWQLNLPEVWSV